MHSMQIFWRKRFRFSPAESSVKSHPLPRHRRGCPIRFPADIKKGAWRKKSSMIIGSCKALIIGKAVIMGLRDR